MALILGSRLGAYEIISLLGAGGMGEVYRATDTVLKRQVALKVLPPEVANDPERIARFQREAEVLAALNHSNIAHLYGIERSDGALALAMELVEGETLADRISRGPIPLNEALPIARQIAEALDAAHEQGIIHRDLKPANIKVRDDGTVKVLDFGLAKALEPTVPSGSATPLTNSPTVTSPALMTSVGVLLGTAAYMSPEQAKGEPANRRSDIWAFGCVLYEMLTGRVPFGRATMAATIAAILSEEPDWSRLPPAMPRELTRLLRRCLEKDVPRRLADVADARLDIEDALSGSHNDASAPRFESRVWERLTWASLTVVSAVVAAVLGARAAGPRFVSTETTRTVLSVTPAGDASEANPLQQRAGADRPTRTAVALSPDGRTLVFSTIWGGPSQLYARPLDRLSALPIDGTSGGSSPFFSPDGEWVGFAADGELRKVPLRGGPAVTLCKAAALFGASWGDDGSIVFTTQRNGGLWRVPATGGTPEELTTPQAGEYSHRLPHMLPGGRAVIFTVLKGPTRWDDAQIVVRNLATGHQTVLVTGGADGRYVATGHLIYLRLGTLMAIPFDLGRLVVTGGATGVIDGVMQAADRNQSYLANTLAGQLTISETGSLVYLTGGPVAADDRSLAWVDRNGRIQALPAPSRSYAAPRLSPDGQRAAVFTLDPLQVWNVDIVRGAISSVTADGDHGVFAPDGKRVAFRSYESGTEGNLSWKAADGSGDAERLTSGSRSQTPSSWSPDGATLAFVEEGESTGAFQFDIWTLSIRDRKTRAVVHTAANEMNPEFSPDGRWLAYASNESGRHEIYVQPYPGPGERHLISTYGGVQPAWNPNGRELFYVQATSSTGSSALPTLMSVTIETVPVFRAGTPVALFPRADLSIAWGRSYDVAPDGRRFLLPITQQAATNLRSPQMVLIERWFEELKRAIPKK